MADNRSSSDNKTVTTRKQMEQSFNEVSTTLEMLSTQADRAGVLGVGRRILVPPDEIHVVVGDGRHVLMTSKKRQVYGQTADRPSYYWLNSLTQVIKLKTISFTVPLRGPNDEGIEALDNSQVSFRIWAHAVAKLNPDKADIAAQRVGLDTTSLINTITKVGTAELVSAAANMDLQAVIAKRQDLARQASQQVNQVLSELGYDLALLTITQLGGMAYEKLIQQAEARVSKEASIVTNREQLIELEDQQAREQREAELRAITEERLAAERLEAEEKVETATLEQSNRLDIRRHELRLKEIERSKDAASAEHNTEVSRIELEHQRNQADAQNKAELARAQAERDAELRAMKQKREAAINLAEAEADAERVALQETRKIERDAKRTEADAKRLRAEELAAAERAREVALQESNQLAEAMKLEAEAEAEARRIRIEAEANAELRRADTETSTELKRASAEAEATEKRAQAAKIRAEATRAETAAPGLAEAEVEAARVEVAEKQVSVTRAKGLAEVEIARATAQAEAERTEELRRIDIAAQEELTSLYEKAPILVELEKIRLQQEHDRKMAALHTETQLKAFQALAPSLDMQIYGSGNQTSQILTEVMSFARSVGYLQENVPLAQQWLGQPGPASEGDSAPLNGLRRLLPYLQETVNQLNPRVMSSLKVADLLERLSHVVAGEEDLAQSLNTLREDTNFRMVSDLPVTPLLTLFGLQVPNGQPSEADEPVIPAE